MMNQGDDIDISGIDRVFDNGDPDTPQIPEIIWDKLKPRFKKVPQGRIIITSTPRGESNFFYELYKNNKMPEHKQLGSIHVVIDTETNQEKIGDVEGGFNEIELRKHINNHGHMGLLETLANMTSSVIRINTEIQYQKHIEEDEDGIKAN